MVKTDHQWINVTINISKRWRAACWKFVCLSKENFTKILPGNKQRGVVMYWNIRVWQSITSGTYLWNKLYNSPHGRIILQETSNKLKEYVRIKDIEVLVVLNEWIIRISKNNVIILQSPVNFDRIWWIFQGQNAEWIIRISKTKL